MGDLGGSVRLCWRDAGLEIDPLPINHDTGAGERKPTRKLVIGTMYQHRGCVSGRGFIDHRVRQVETRFEEDRNLKRMKTGGTGHSRDPIPTDSQRPPDKTTVAAGRLKQTLAQE